jgi:DNA-directed RNA polymerase subunit RPC12/RpoP
MAVKQMTPKGDEDKVTCPKCGEKALIIDGRFIKWLTCPSCKYKKLIKKEDEAKKVRIVSLK